MEKNSLLTLAGETLPLSVSQLELYEEPWHGMCNKAEGFHLAYLCLHLMANRPFTYLQAQVLDSSGQEHPVWFIQKQSEVWSLDQDLAAIAPTLYSNTPKIAKIELGIPSYLAIFALETSLPVGSLLAKKPDRWGTGEGYGYRSMNAWESSIQFLRNRSLLPTFPENLVIFEALQWGLQHLGASSWPQLFELAVARTQILLQESQVSAHR